MSDGPRWNDQAIDQLAKDVDRHDDELVAMRKLPERMADMNGELRTVTVTLSDFRDDMREDFRDLRRTQQTQVATGAATPTLEWWKLTLSGLALVGVPLLLGYLTIRYGGIPQK